MKFVSNCFFLLLCNLLYPDDSVNSVNEEYIEEADTNIKEHIDSDIDEASSVFLPDSAVVGSKDNKPRENTVSRPTNIFSDFSNRVVDVNRNSVGAMENTSTNGSASFEGAPGVARDNASPSAATDGAGFGKVGTEDNVDAFSSIRTEGFGDVMAAVSSMSSLRVIGNNGSGAEHVRNPASVALTGTTGISATPSDGALPSVLDTGSLGFGVGVSDASSMLTDTFLTSREDAQNLEKNKPISEIAENNREDVTGNQNEIEDAEFDSLFSSYSYEKVTQTTVQILNKISGECFNFPVKVGDVLVFKKLRIRVYNCFKTPSTEKLEHIGFIEIWEVQDLKPILIHSGWMFSNHSVNIMQDPEYDVRIVN